MQIVIDSLYYSYNDDENYVLEDINLQVGKGEIIAIIGATGSGKSTLIQIINSLIYPTKGKAWVSGFKISKDNKKVIELRKKVSLVFQYPEYQLFEETVYKDICFGPENLGFSKEEIDQKINKVIESLNIDKKYLEFSPFDLSGGQKRKVALAGVLSMDTDIILLDEPTNGLDGNSKREFYKLIKSLNEDFNKTIVFITHSMDEVLKLADRVIELKKGKIINDLNTLDYFSKKDVNKPDIVLLNEKLRSKNIIESDKFLNKEEIISKILEYKND